MEASVPHDVDLEDRLVFGLTPVRFGYLVLGVLAAAAVWNLRQLPLTARLGPCVLVTAVAAALAWGRWRGRPLDRLALDAAIFGRRNYRLQVASPARRRARAVPDRSPPRTTLRLAAINAVARRRPETPSLEKAA